MTTEDLTALLSSLGDTPDAVAETLRREGCVGERWNPFHCPVACYLRRRLPHVRAEVSVRADGCAVWPDPGAAPVLWSTPGAVRVFLERFDGGGYTGLRLSESTVSP